MAKIIDAICSSVYGEDSSIATIIPKSKAIDDLTPYDVVFD